MRFLEPFGEVKAQRRDLFLGGIPRKRWERRPSCRPRTKYHRTNMPLSLLTMVTFVPRMQKPESRCCEVCSLARSRQLRQFTIIESEGLLQNGLNANHAGLMPPFPSSLS